MIVRDDRDGVRVLRLAHGKVGAIDIELAEAFAREMDAAATDDVRAVIVTGTGSAFSAGIDLFRVLKDGADYCRRFLHVFDTFLQSALTFPKPLVAAVNGHAIAGGCMLAAVCDRRVMAEGNGRIGIPELAVGVPFPALLFKIMAARLSDRALRDLVFNPRTVGADEALAMNLIDETCPQDRLLDRAIESARAMAQIPAGAFALTKEAFYAPILDRAKRLTDLNDRVTAEWIEPRTYDAIRAYLERTVVKKQ